MAAEQDQFRFYHGLRAEYPTRALLEKGADVNAKTDAGFTPLCDAAQFGHKEIVELIIAKGADVNAKRGAPLNAAIITKHTEIAELLRKHGAKTGEELKAEGK